MLCDMDVRTFGADSAIGGDSDHRRASRVPIQMVAKLRDRLSNKYDIRILDLSVTGFRAEAHYALEPGAIVWLTIPGMQGLEANIAWRRDSVIGCSFRSPLYPAVLDHIVRTLR